MILYKLFFTDVREKILDLSSKKSLMQEDKILKMLREEKGHSKWS